MRISSAYKVENFAYISQNPANSGNNVALASQITYCHCQLRRHILLFSSKLSRGKSSFHLRLNFLVRFVQSELMSACIILFFRTFPFSPRGHAVAIFILNFWRIRFMIKRCHPIRTLNIIFTVHRICHVARNTPCAFCLRF